ncbi:hypothetical protein P872_00220 [Rhodonellum psychrophilum GCM71 = DSM 17998]|uniref:BIG2 domain-containing protein n=3 Tax=Cytophagaceae TaxID=89373 RepID=U5C5L7_9BACT|nr:hypothetical protein P872_00220 [Rhodonellum psychrophilum GCM71 = DSM 17998]
MLENFIFISGIFLFLFLIPIWIQKGDVFSVDQFLRSQLNRRFNGLSTSILALVKKGSVGVLVLGGMFFLGTGEVKGQCDVSQDFTNTSSLGTFTVPSGVTSITLEVWGAGGGGAGRGNNGTGGGGGGGAYSRSVLAVTPGADLRVSVGSGGGSNSAGGDSWVSTSTVVANAIILARGGLSPGNNIATGALGGNATTGVGNIRFSGGRGANAGTDGGGGGSSAGSAANGTNATGSSGANAPADGGGGGDGKIGTQGNGISGDIPGGGGGGAKRTNNGTRTGGNGANGQIRITYNASPNTSTSVAPNRTLCINVALSTVGNITHATTGASGIGTATGLPAGVTATWSSNTITISGTPTLAGTFNYSIPMTGGCTSGQAPATGTITVNSRPTPTFTAPPSGSICPGTSVTYTTQTGNTNYSWSVSGTAGTDYTITAGGIGTGSNTVTLTWLTPGSKTVTVNYTNSNGCASVTPGTNTITVTPNKSASTSPNPTVCAVSGNPNITHTTTGVTGIGTATGLPTGVTASFSGGLITISGNPTQLGTFNYSIPLIGTCGPDAFATGTITVTNCSCEEIFTSNGTFQVPLGVTQIIVETWGGGGRGATRTTSGRGGGGGGGGYSRSILTVSTGQNYNYTVGAGGNNSVINGGNTIFGSNIVVANGGSGATNNSETRGVGGVLGIGDVRYVGGNGATATTSGSGGGGSSASSTANGSIGAVTNGGTITGGGNGGDGTNSNSPGENGQIFGGGGGGARNNGSSQNGGTGGDGRIKITYTLTAGVVSGPQSICLGSTTTLSSTLAGGTWSSSNEAIATVNPTTGVVTGLSIGITAIRYTIVGSCAIATTSRTVFVTQPIIAGTLAGTQEVCIGGTSQFSSTTTNGTWSSNNTAVATVSSTGLVTGLTAGTATISYTLPASGGCPPSVATRIINVSAPPTAGTLSGGEEVCVGGNSTFSSTSTGGTWVSNNPTIASVNPSTGIVTGITPGTATLTYTVAGTGGCPNATATRSVTVTAAPIAGTLSGSDELCVGDDATFSSSMPGGTWSSSNSTIVSVNSTTGELIAVSAGTATITYTMTGTGGCADVTATRSVTVYALPNPTFIEEPTSDVCVGTSVIYSTQAGQFDYEWAVEGIEGTDYSITGGGIGTTNNTVSLIWLTAGTKEVSVNYSNVNGCNVNPIYNTITIDPLPLPAFTVQPTNPVCIGELVTYTTQVGQSNYSWTIPGIAGTDYNIIAGGIGTSSNSVTLEWQTNGSKTVTVNYSNANACTGVNPAFNTIVLDPLPVPTFTAQPANQVCIGDEVTYTTQAGQSNYTWIIPGTAGTDYYITAGGIGTTSNTVTIDWRTHGTKTVTVNYSNANGCTGVNPAFNTIVLDPLPVPTFTAQPANPVCIGDEVTYTTQAGQFNYTWSIPGTAGIDYNITAGDIGATSNTVTIEWLTNGTKTVNLNYQDANGCSGISPVSNTIEISIYTSIDIQPDLFGDLECFGDGFDPISVSATGSNLSYQWYVKPDNSDVSTNPGTSVSGAISASFTPPSTSEGTSFYYVVVTGNCGIEFSMLAGPFIVNPSGTLITVSPAVFDETICFEEGLFSELTVAALGDGGSAVTYQWYQNTTPDNFGGTLLTGKVSANFTPPSDVSVADGLPRYYYATASSSCGTVPTAISGAFIVNPPTAIDDESLAGATICEDDGPFAAISVTASGTGTLSYQWYANTTGVINTAIDPQVGTNSNSFTPLSNIPDANPRYYYVVVLSTNGCGPNVISTISGAFIVNPNNTVSAPSSTPTACINIAIPNITHTTTNAIGIGTPSGLPAGISAIWSANVITVSGTPTQSGAFTYSIPLTGGCGNAAATGTITVTPDMTVNTSQANGSTCINQNLAAITFNTILATGIGAPTGLPAGVIANWAGNVITISGTPTVSGSFNYSIPLTGGCGTAAATGSITVTPDMTVNSAQANGTTCINQTLTSITHSTTSATGIGSATGLPSGVIASWNANVITISGTPTQSGSFNYSIPLTGGCGTVAATGTITVTPTMTVTTAQANGTVCITESLTAITHNTTEATGIGAATGLPAGLTASWNANVITISGTPTISGNFNYSIPLSGGCGTVAASGTITVNPVPVINNIMASPICSGDTFIISPVNGTNGIVPAGTLYTWTFSNNPNVTGETAQATPQGTFSQTLTNTSNVNQTVTYTVTPRTAAGCTGATFEVAVVVKPRPTVNSIANQAAVCSGTPSTAVNFSGSGIAGVVYNWTNSNSSIGLPSSGTGNIPSFTTVNTGPAPISSTITVTPIANGCSGPSQTFTITVNPTPIVTVLADYCAVAGSVELVASSTVPGTTWLWNTGETTSSILVNTAGLFSVTGTSPNGCTATTFFSVAEELVVDGSFTNFDPANPTFFTEYTQNQAYYVNGNGSTGLWPEGYYAVNVNAQGNTTTNPPGYHSSFYGRDHTNNSIGDRNFMMVNGGALVSIPTGSPLRQPIIWEQTVTIEPNTEYYFSAWAMNLNPASPARLQFEINGVLVGTVLDLNGAPKPTSNAAVNLDNWRQFYSDPTWSSGDATTAVIRIVNLNTDLGGNDFGLDDISFGTLSPFIKLTSAVGTDDSQVVCENSPIIDIEYRVGGGLAGPVVENLPPGVTNTWNGVNLRFSGSPTQAGTYNYTIFTTGACLQVRATGTIVVRDTPTAGIIASDQTVCAGEDPAAIIGDAYAPQESGATISYRWELNTNLGTPNWIGVPGNPSGVNYDPPILPETTQYRRFTSSTVAGLSCESPPTAPVTITVQREPTAGSIATDQEICEGDDPAAFTSTIDGTGDGNITYRWEFTNASNPSWTTIAGASGATYDSPALSETTQFRRGTISTLNGVACESVPTSPVQVTVIPNNTVTPVDPNPTLCLNTISPVIITHNTTGATGIVPQSASVNYNLPNGVTPNWIAGVLTIQGTPTEFGVFNYSIPLTGGCGSVSATGIITVENPTYPIVAINVVNPTLGSSPPFTSTFTVYSNELTIGTYTINYSIDGANGGPNQTISVTVTTPGEFTFTSQPYSNEGTTILTINSIKKDTEVCTYYPPNNNTVPYGINCSAEFLNAGGNGVFYVPANIFQLTIQVFGEGLGGNTASQAKNVLPGGAIFIVFDGTNVFATEVPPTEPMADRLAQAIVSTTGGNGRIVINYDCTPPPPCSGSGDVFQYTDSEGYTVIRVTGDCSSWIWSAPDGLDEFEVLVVGGGGGGGFGAAAGGGGGGAAIYQQYLGITMNGLPGLQNAVFQMTPGGLGLGGTMTERSKSGEASIFTGPGFAYLGGNTFTNLNAAGGGGGGSTSADPLIRQGGAGASGGGGAANGTVASNGGTGTAGNNGGSANGQTSGYSGAGGGGVSTLGGDGTSSGSGAVMTGGTGGNGMMRSISGEEIYYGAGGGGTASGAITNEAGYGGSPYNGANGDQFFAGGNGNNNGMGQPATTYGSGGGAGRFGGSAGFQGVVYIRYPNFRILPIEYLFFNAEYNSFMRSGDLTWASAKEWENDRFEIERSVNNIKDWETIGQVTGAGYSDQPVAYAFQDMKLPLAGGNIFYRLKQFDFNGNSNYSVTKALKVDPMAGTTYWKVFPNPTTGDPVNMEMLDKGTYKDERITVRVISAIGVFEVIEGDSPTQLSAQLSLILRRKAAGIYTVEISWGAFQEYHKVILRR